jgi:oligoendopeptidase F
VDAATVPTEETWDLDELFADDRAFERARAELEALLPSLESARGRLGESAARLADALAEITDAYRRFGLLRSYASLKADLDTRDGERQALRQSIGLLATDLSGRLAWLRPELLSLEPETLESFITEEPRLAEHAFFLRDLMRQRDHVLSPPEERILAETSLLTRAASSLYTVLHNVDLPRPEVTLSGGEKVTLTPVAFSRHRATTVREDRLKLFPAYFGSYSAFRNTLGQNLYAAVKNHMFRSRVRGYRSSLAASLDGDNVPEEVYRNLIRQVRAHLPVMDRYFVLRARALGLERLEYPDLYCPLNNTPPRDCTTKEAWERMRESLAPLGEEYRAALDLSLDRRWIDWHPVVGKRAGAYASGMAYDLHPFVLLNYTGNYESVSTLAHEMGHAMHSHFSNRTQPFATADYSIFVAEVASTLNEALLAAREIEQAPTPEEQRTLLGNYLDGIRGTLFRQAMFAEFELEIHERAERGEVLTGERLDQLYLDLLRDYHGHDRGVVRVADEYAIEWAAVPHFYYDFYVYQYATGIVAATALAAAISSDEPGAAERYLEFLRSGGSAYPLELLRRAGVDLEAAAPYDAAFDALDRQLEALARRLELRP